MGKDYVNEMELIQTRQHNKGRTLIFSWWWWWSGGGGGGGKYEVGQLLPPKKKSKLSRNSWGRNRAKGAHDGWG